MALKKNNSNHPREIDKSKKSNRRCGNCASYVEKNPGDIYNECKCGITGQKKEYWNCCKKFSWRRDRNYKGEVTPDVPVAPASCGNTKIFYLYKDGSNYKVHNEAVVKGTITKEQANEIFDCTYAGSFIPGDVGLPENRFDDYTSDDTDWFELHNPEEAFFATAEEPTVDMTVDELVARFASMRDQWKKQWEL